MEWWKQRIAEAVYSRTKKAVWEWPDKAVHIMDLAYQVERYREKEEVKARIVDRICYVIEGGDVELPDTTPERFGDDPREIGDDHAGQ